MEDQEMEGVPVAIAVQKELLLKYLALRMPERKGFLLVAMFQAA